MSSTDPFLICSNNNDSRDLNVNSKSTSHRSRSVSSTQYKDRQETTRTSTDSEVSDLVPSYVDILAATNSGHDWLESYEFPTVQPQEKISHRRTFQHTIIDKSPTVSVRKTRSMRDHSSGSTSRTKLRSPPPPPPPPQDNTPLNLLFEHQQQVSRSGTNEKKQSLPFINKVKRKLSFNKEKTVTENTRSSLPPPSKPRRTVSSGILPGDHQFPTNNTLAEYQGYSRHSRHRSFTYSPPPPPRTSSLQASSSSNVSSDKASIIPPVPPVPKQHVASNYTITNTSPKSTDEHSKFRQSTINKKKSDSFSPSSESSGSNRNNAASTTSTSVQHSVTPVKSTHSPNNADTTTAYNLSHDLAQIEEDIKALEIQRQSFILANNQSRLSTEPKTVGRKRGKVMK